MNLIYTNKR